MMGVQCYVLFGGIALKNHAFLDIMNNVYGVKMPILEIVNFIPI